LKPKFKFWLETEDGYVFGLGSFELLQGIQEKGTLTASAKALNMSYRHAWGIIKQIEVNLRQAILVTHKGGKDGGGSKLTPLGQELLVTYLQYQKAFNEIGNK
jgi:molybdate transport repressor ModE-like protein